MRRYTILLDPDPDDGAYTVTVPALPGVVTEGNTLEEAIAHAREAIECYLEWLTKHGRPIPPDDVRQQALVVEVSEEAAA